MDNEFLIHLTGMCALVLNVLAIIMTCERRLRVHSGIAGLVWALNNLLLGAHSAAALSLVSAGRTASSAVTLQSDAARRRLAFIGFAVLTLLVCALTWQGWLSVFLVTASLLSTYAMFYMRGRGAALGDAARVDAVDDQRVVVRVVGAGRSERGHGRRRCVCGAAGRAAYRSPERSQSRCLFPWPWPRSWS